jgi:DHA1 family multidrug resistance protein-like MFS transporter
MRLRKVTGNQELKSQAMIDTAHLSAGDLAQEYLWRPMVLFFEPILLVYNTYLALIYGMSPSSHTADQ